MRIQVTFTIDDDDEYADPDHEMGITAATYERIIRDMPGYDIEVERVEE